VVDVGINGEDHLFLGDPEVHIALGRGRVGTVVNDPVHVEVEVVESRDRVRGDELGREGVPLGDPSEELRDTCSGQVSSNRLSRSIRNSLPMMLRYAFLFSVSSGSVWVVCKTCAMKLGRSGVVILARLFCTSSTAVYW
jgi:hypothetical protein